jgi:hypothetical protein
MHLFLSTQFCSSKCGRISCLSRFVTPDLAGAFVGFSVFLRTSHVESTHFFSKLCFIPVFLVCIILHAEASEVTLLRCLVQELEHHRSHHAWIEVVGGRALVSRLVGFLPRSRVVTTATAVSIKMMAAATNVHGGQRPYPILCLTRSRLRLMVR